MGAGLDHAAPRQRAGPGERGHGGAGGARDSRTGRGWRPDSQQLTYRAAEAKVMTSRLALLMLILLAMTTAAHAQAPTYYTFHDPLVVHNYYLSMSSGDWTTF